MPEEPVIQPVNTAAFLAELTVAWRSRYADTTFREERSDNLVQELLGHQTLVGLSCALIFIRSAANSTEVPVTRLIQAEIGRREDVLARIEAHHGFEQDIWDDEPIDDEDPGDMDAENYDCYMHDDSMAIGIPDNILNYIPFRRLRQRADNLRTSFYLERNHVVTNLGQVIAATEGLEPHQIRQLMLYMVLTQGMREGSTAQDDLRWVDQLQEYCRTIVRPSEPESTVTPEKIAAIAHAFLMSYPANPNRIQEQLVLLEQIMRQPDNWFSDWGSIASLLNSLEHAETAPNETAAITRRAHELGTLVAGIRRYFEIKQANPIEAVRIFGTTEDPRMRSVSITTSMSSSFSQASRLREALANAPIPTRVFTSQEQTNAGVLEEVTRAANSHGIMINTINDLHLTEILRWYRGVLQQPRIPSVGSPSTTYIGVGPSNFQGAIDGLYQTSTGTSYGTTSASGTPSMSYRVAPPELDLSRFELQPQMEQVFRLCMEQGLVTDMEITHETGNSRVVVRFQLPRHPFIEQIVPGVIALPVVYPSYVSIKGTITASGFTPDPPVDKIARRLGRVTVLEE